MLFPKISVHQLIASIPVKELMHDVEPKQKVLGLTSDSRKVEPGFVFVALRGEELDGHQFIQDAFDKGCIAAVVEDFAGLPKNKPLIIVTDSHQAYGLMAAEYFSHPARGMKIIGLTGTNGKTTTSWIIEKIIDNAGGSTGVIGTVNYRYRSPEGKNVTFDAQLTTPEPMMLQRLLREMNDAGVSHVILEVSSHSLTQQRLAAMLFDVGVFTNLSRDHLDYHKSMDEYFHAKRKLFDDHMKPSGIAVVALVPDEQRYNNSRDWGKKLARKLKKRGFVPYPAKSKTPSIMTCGFDKKCTIRASKLSQNREGLTFRITFGNERLDVRSKLIGLHNVSNMLMAAGACYAIGIDSNVIFQGLQEVQSIPGRLERVMLPGLGEAHSSPYIFVDYAHTPDALENVLNTLRPVTQGKLFCVFGCGGDRDRGKRPLMGAVAGKIADRVIVTSDNPRNEPPKAILKEIEKGLVKTGKKKAGLDKLFSLKKQKKSYTVLEDRSHAIHQVCSRAEDKDVVLIAGKGHETYQITKTGKHYFDDRIEARNGILRWTIDHLQAATSGVLIRRGKTALFGRISTDTRTIEPGDVFVALKGENFDGHEYLKVAVKKGAAAVIVHEKCKGLGKNVSVLRVDDTLQALGDIAHYRRCLVGSDIRVIGITGSSGKTTVKEMTASIFEAEYADKPGKNVLKTQGNLNNLIGLPLSLLNIDGGHRVAVMEMGMNRPGEIKRLTRVAEPDIGCITNVQAAHLEGLETIEGVARAKGELFSEISSKGLKVINYDDNHVRRLGGSNGNNVITYAVTPIGRRFNPTVRATRIVSLGEAGMRFTLHINAWRKRIDVPATGLHNVANCAAAAAIATAARVAPEVIVQGLMKYKHGDKRMQIIDLPGGIHVVNDSYNANPASMAAALKTVVGFGTKCRRVALLGDMFELGRSAVEAHRGVGELVAKLGYDYLCVTGEHGENIAETARRCGMRKSRIKVCKNKEAVAKWVMTLIDKKKIGSDDWLLIKGSRGMRMEQVLHSLTQRLTLEKN